MGFRAAFGALFGAGVTLVGGWLTSFGWRYAFFGYLFAIPVALLVLFFCPSNEPIKKEKTSSSAGEKKYTRKTFYVLLFAIFFNACMMSFNVELSLVITGENIGGNLWTWFRLLQPHIQPADRGDRCKTKVWLPGNCHLYKLCGTWTVPLSLPDQRCQKTAEPEYSQGGVEDHIHSHHLPCCGCGNIHSCHRRK